MKRFALIVLVLSACLVAGLATAGSARTWSASSPQEFARGQFHGTSLDTEGRVRLAPTVDKLWGPESGIVWDVAADGADGVFVALSSPGRVLRVVAGSEPEVWFAAEEESLVAAIASDGAGGVYIGVSPSGMLLHAVAPGEVRELAETGSTFIWSLDRDRDGAVWIATGIPGKVQRYADGELSDRFDAGDDPVRCIRSLDGDVVFGTGGRGRMIRLDGDGRAHVLLDAEEAEIVAVERGEDGSIYALAARGTKQVSSAKVPVVQESVRVTAEPPAAKEENGTTDDAKKTAAKRKTPPRRFETPPGGVLYRVQPDGDAQIVWKTAREVPFDLQRAGDGRLLVATGDTGRIYAIDGEGRSAVLLEAPSDQASALASAPDGSVLIGTTTSARVGRIGPTTNNPGAYVTQVVDAGAVADWGRVVWEGEAPSGTELSLSVRSGNTVEPDETWSDWRDLGSGAEGGEATGVDASRFVQVAVDMTPSRRGRSPSLRYLELFHAPRNRRPTIDELTVHPAGVVWTRVATPSARPLGPQVTTDPVMQKTVQTLRPAQAQKPVRKSYEPGARTISWKAADPDGDRLTYRVELRNDRTSNWIPMADDLETDFYGLDGRSLPDGLYRVRVTVVDAPDNPEGEQYEAMRIGPAFRIDNTRPSVGRQRVRRQGQAYEVEFVASDPGGNVASVEVALDAGAWRVVEPLDGVADSEQERYQVTIEADAERTPAVWRMIKVRVTDAAGNLGGDAWELETP